MKKILSFGLGIFFLVAGLAGITESVSPSFLVQADAASLSVIKSSAVLTAIGSVLFILGLSIIIFKFIKGRPNHG